ncbi:hypothetical protein [Luteibacter sp. RCC_6_2]|uniref:hypothetical protein n=1 Tax=Luteibacter sp. RCC_6_2 TaxID=3239223 RepID=UPI003523A62A
MATFLTRIELHSADAADYQRLHEEMAKKGFSRAIPDDNGVKYYLPTAEYYWEGNLSAEAVRQLADIAIAATGKAGWVITAQWASASWRLPRA